MKKNIIIITIGLTLLLSGCTSGENEMNNNGTSSPVPSKSPASVQAPNDTDESTKQETSETEQNTNLNGTDQNNANQNSVNQNGEMISKEEVKSIALAHAGVTAEQATFIKCGLDRDNGKQVYDVEFYTKDDKEYDYDIDPYTGDVLNFDYETEYRVTSSGVEINIAHTNNAHSDIISEEEAKKIALEKVPGAATEDIWEFKIGQKNGRVEYEGKIYFEQKEYEFEIDGASGEILEWDVEDIYK